VEPLEIRYLAAEDYDAESSARLLAWCHAHGADEFTVSLIGVTSPDADILASSFHAAFEPYRRASATRRRLSGTSAKDLVRETELWALTDESLSALEELLHDGLFTYDSHLDLWPEDVAVYRVGEFMLGVITHESGGVLRVTFAELKELAESGLPYRESVPWVGY
jgi:hypothetical protein